MVLQPPFLAMEASESIGSSIEKLKITEQRHNQAREQGQKTSQSNRPVLLPDIDNENKERAIGWKSPSVRQPQVRRKSSRQQADSKLTTRCGNEW